MDEDRVNVDYIFVVDGIRYRRPLGGNPQLQPMIQIKAANGHEAAYMQFSDDLSWDRWGWRTPPPPEPWDPWIYSE